MIDIRTKEFVLKKNPDLLISIQDPFELGRDLGDIIKTSESAERIINKIKYTLKQLSVGKSLHQLIKNS